MKLNHPRLLLISGLSIAFGLHAVSTIAAATNAKSKAIRLAQAPTDLKADPVPLPTNPNATPDWKPTPIDSSSPNPTPPPTSALSAPNASPAPQSPSTSPPVTTAPMPLGTQPNLSPANRPPLGLFYGEQDKLDDLANPKRARPLPSVPYPGPVNPPSALPSVVGEPTIVGAPRVLEGGDVGGPALGTDRWGIAPPPGTLGQTYKRRTRMIEDTKHPRVGVVEVNLPEGVDVTAVGLKSKWTGKVWRLESEPLLPGIPHIYEIKASWGEDLEPQVRTVRLIMGRVVELDF